MDENGKSGSTKEAFKFLFPFFQSFFLLKIYQNKKTGATQGATNIQNIFTIKIVTHQSTNRKLQEGNMKQSISMTNCMQCPNVNDKSIKAITNLPQDICLLH